jgi:uncharacterized repeat protein (TIGR01451 family)
MRAAYRRLAAVGLAVGVGVAVADPPLAQPVRPAFAPPAPAEAVCPAAGCFTPDLEVAIPAGDRPAGPAVSLDWTGPATVRLGRPTPYTLTVRNTCAQPVQQVTVQVRPPDGATIAETTPASHAVDQVHVWEVGALRPGEARHLAVTLAGGRRGGQTCQAWVTFTGTAGMTVTVEEPKLEARIETPLRAVVGEPFRVTYKVTNVGDCRVKRVTTSRSCPGMSETFRVSVRTMGTHFIGRDHPDLPPHNPPAADLLPGESTEFSRECVTDKPGEYLLTVTAGGEGEVGAAASRFVQVVAPSLAAAVSGPDARLVGRRAAYTVTASNPGEVAVVDALVTAVLPAGLRDIAALDGGTVADGRLTWLVGRLAPGETQTVRFEATAAAVGVQTIEAAVSGSRKARATAECRTMVDGIPALRCEVADLADPVEAGHDTTYEIRLTNTGTKADEDVKLVCELPEAIRFVLASGPTGHWPVFLPVNEGGSAGRPARMGQSVRFEPIRELAPKTEAVFRVTVRAAAAGDVRFKAVVTSKHLTAPVVKEESTRVYGD